jgi:hypothetical protein
MAVKRTLTNQHLSTKFTNSFELVNYAIRLAKNMIQSERPCRIPTPVQNRAFQILLEIAEGKDLFDDISALPEKKASERDSHDHRTPHDAPREVWNEKAHAKFSAEKKKGPRLRLEE